MNKGNVILIGNSGVGKSTLINAVIGKKEALTGYGTEGTTKKIKIYENADVSFRLIDTIGFEPSFWGTSKAVSAVRKWSKSAAKTADDDRIINMVWICVDGTSRKLFKKNIENIISAISIWKSVPVFVVITKSYSVPERAENIQMIKEAFAKQTKITLTDIIPVVASTYQINNDVYVEPDGITELITRTNDCMPEGIRAAEEDIKSYILKRKRVLAQTVIAVASTAGGVVGAIPIPFADAAILAPVEITEINSLAKIYDIPKNEKTKKFAESIIEAGTVGTAAKGVISGIKAIPGINIAGSALNAIIASVFVASIGEASCLMFEQICKGNKTLDDIEWAKEVVANKLNKDGIAKVKKILQKKNNGKQR